MSDSWHNKLSVVSNVARSTVDTAVQENASLAASSGLDAKIVRKTMGECCDWCRSIAGTYKYPGTPTDVFRRHDNCDCVVEYVVDKSRQNVYTKKWTRAGESDKIEERKQVGMARQKTGNRTTKEYAEYRRELQSVKNRKQIDLPKDEYAMVMRCLNTDLSEEDRKHAIILKPIGNYVYTVINRGYGDYVIIGKEPIL